MTSHRKLIWNCSKKENRKNREPFKRNSYRKRYLEMPNWKRWSTSAERKLESDLKRKFSALTCSKMKWSRSVWFRTKRRDKRRSTSQRCFSRMKRTYRFRRSLRRNNGKKTLEPKKRTPGCSTSKSKIGLMRSQQGRKHTRYHNISVFHSYATTQSYLLALWYK